MLRQSLKKCEFNLFLNQIIQFPFTMCVQFDYKTDWIIYKEHSDAKHREKVPAFFLTLISRNSLLKPLKGSSLFFFKFSDMSKLNKFLHSKIYFNIIFFPLYKKMINVCNLYLSSIVIELKKKIWDVSFFIFCIKNFLVRHIVYYYYIFFNSLLLLSKR